MKNFSTYIKICQLKDLFEHIYFAPFIDESKNKYIGNINKNEWYDLLYSGHAWRDRINKTVETHSPNETEITELFFTFRFNIYDNIDDGILKFNEPFILKDLTTGISAVAVILSHNENNDKYNIKIITVGKYLEDANHHKMKAFKGQLIFEIDNFGNKKIFRL